MLEPDERLLTIGVVIPTHRPQQDQLTILISTIQKSSLYVSILIIDSSSNDGTLELTEKLGVETLVIPQAEFNHGMTRELARKHIATDIVVMLTQDVCPVSADFLEKLVLPIMNDESIAVTYARQVAYPGSGILESFPREFNYQAQSNVRSINDLDKYGVYTFFSSDSCAAYRNDSLNEIGGFDPVLTSEDYFVAAKLLIKGYKIAYVAESVVFHSHNFTLWQEFQRYFDIGYVRAENPFVQELVGNVERRGLGLVRALLERLIKDAPLLIPYAILQSGVKFLGYRVGITLGNKLPEKLKTLFSMQRYYWHSKYYKALKK